MTDTTRKYVETMMRGKLDSLALAARAYDNALDVADDEIGTAPQGEGIEAGVFLRELVLEARTPKDATCTDFVLTLGGPRIWVRFWTTTDDAAIYGQANGMGDPVKWPIERGTEAYRAVELFLDFDVMEEQL